MDKKGQGTWKVCLMGMMEISVDITSGMDKGHEHDDYAQMLWHNLWHI